MPRAHTESVAAALMLGGQLSGVDASAAAHAGLMTQASRPQLTIHQFSRSSVPTMGEGQTGSGDQQPHRAQHGPGGHRALPYVAVMSSHDATVRSQPAATVRLSRSARQRPASKQQRRRHVPWLPGAPPPPERPSYRRRPLRSPSGRRPRPDTPTWPGRRSTRPSDPRSNARSAI
jgi:hypothetical protein